MSTVCSNRKSRASWNLGCDVYRPYSHGPHSPSLKLLSLIVSTISLPQVLQCRTLCEIHSWMDFSAIFERAIACDGERSPDFAPGNSLTTTFQNASRASCARSSLGFIGKW